jgi:hypothetical protein
MSFYCSECVVGWWPYQCRDGCCPVCGGGTVRRQERAGDDADAVYRELVAGERRRHAREQFEAFYAARELARSGEVIAEAEAILRAAAA